MKFTKAGFKLKRSMKFGAASTALTVIFIGAIVLVNIFAAVLVEKYPLKLDITGEKIYQISAETKDMLKNLNQDVVITILTPESKFDTTAAEIIKKYAQSSDKIKFNAVDISVNPGLAAKYQSGGQQLDEQTIIVESGKRFKLLSVEDLYQYNTDGTNLLGIKAEQKLTSAVMYVTSADVPGYYSTTGHEEKTAQYLTNVASENNFKTDDVNLLTGNIPDDAKVISVYSPARDFTAEEIQKLDQFVNRGNTGLMIFLSPDSGSLPKLESYMAEWGIAKNNDIVLDADNAMSMANVIVANPADHDITKAVKNRGSTLILPNCSSLQLLFDEKNSYSTKALLNTFATAYSKSINGEPIKDTAKTQNDKDGPFTGAAISTKMVSGNNTVINSYMFVFGSAEFAGDTALSLGTFGNSDVMASALTYVRGNKDLVTISPKYFNDKTMNISAFEARILGFIFIGIVPLVFVVLGIVVFVRRKHL